MGLIERIAAGAGVSSRRVRLTRHDTYHSGPADTRLRMEYYSTVGQLVGWYKPQDGFKVFYEILSGEGADQENMQEVVVHYLKLRADTPEKVTVFVSQDAPSMNDVLEAVRATQSQKEEPFGL